MKKSLLKGVCISCLALPTMTVAEPMKHPVATTNTAYKIAVGPKIFLQSGQAFQNPDEVFTTSKENPLPLTIGYSRVIYNKNRVILRTYNDKLVGPTVHVKPNETLYVNLENKLSKKDPHAVSNLHTHGLHVSPSGDQDNIFLSVDAGGKQSYAIQVPADQRRGSQWYHPHVHGNTSFQVTQGMEGALIVDDDPATLPDALKVKENILIVQYLPIEAKAAQVDQAMNVKTVKKAADGTDKKIITINGQVTPKITINQGEVQRWRFTNATPFLTLTLKLGDLPLNEIAVDGMYLGAIDTWPAGTPLTMQPGNRSDVLIKAPDDCSADKCPPINLTNNDKVIATVEFTATGKPMPLPSAEDMKHLKTWRNIDTEKVTGNSQAVQFQEENCDDPKHMCVDGLTFSASNPPRPLPLDKTQAWNLWTADKDHVFHIHVNPFQTTRKGPHGADEIIWMDTVLVPEGSTQENPVKVWTTYENITGQSVLHCHILPHEDDGMMQAINIQPAEK